MKDNFSDKSENYKQFRPDYPLELFDFILANVAGFEAAWDCGTGNGQIARGISPRFRKVFATDISGQQIARAEKLPNVAYSVQPAEAVDFPDHIFDLIMVGQAVHWFDFRRFYAEVHRTSKKGALIALVGYGKLSVDPAVDAAINRLYITILGGYWDRERKYIDENYTTLPFPFPEIPCPEFVNTCQWTLQHMLGYLDTWSAVKHYQRRNNRNPVEEILDELYASWPEGGIKAVTFPILCRLGKIMK